jgi:periplasmic copper chaperone A
MRAIRAISAACAIGMGIAGATLVAWANEASSKGVTVAHPWVRATPEGATITAAFMEIRTDAGVTDRLISAASPAAGRVEVHSHTMEGDVMKMRRLEALDLKAGESHVLKPMGEHMMLFDVKQPLKEGDVVKLQLTFEKAGIIEIEGSVEPVAANGPHGMDHKPGAGDGMDGMKHEEMDHKHHE